MKQSPQKGITLIPVVSSLASHIGYDAPSSTLAVQHHDGSQYHYHNVGPGTAMGLFNSTSKGAYLHKYVRGKYEHTQIK